MVLEKLIELLCEQLDIEADEVNENTWARIRWM